MSAITDKIRAEHVSRFFDCSCGHIIAAPYDGTVTTHADMFGRHIAAVTEAAVRAHIAADIGHLRADAALASPVSYSAAREDAARIARGEPR